MALIIAVILGILALAFVLYPLYAGASRPNREAATTVSKPVEASQSGETLELIEQEQTARSAIQEVELDYQLGNIEETDYRSLRERYMQRAMTALKSRYEHEQDIDAEIEKQLQTLKESYEKTNHK